MRCSPRFLALGWMCLVTKLNLFFSLPYTHRIIYCSIPHHFSCLFMAHVLLTFTLMLLPLSNAFCLETIDLTAPKVWVCLCFTAGRALGWQQLMPVLGQREKKKEEGAREHQLWSIKKGTFSPGVYTRDLTLLLPLWDWGIRQCEVWHHRKMSRLVDFCQVEAYSLPGMPCDSMMHQLPNSVVPTSTFGFRWVRHLVGPTLTMHHFQHPLCQSRTGYQLLKHHKVG